MHRVCIYCREEVGGSVSDLRSKKKGSNKSLNVGGSLMNIGNKQVGIKKLASSGNIEKAIAKSHHLFSVGYKLDKVGGKAKKSLSSLKLVGFIFRLNRSDLIENIFRTKIRS